MTAPPVRAIHVDDLGELDPLVDDDLIRNGLWNLEGPHGHECYPLADGENWDYTEIEDAWHAHVVRQLAEHGIRWDQATDMVTLPTGVSDETARQIWHGITRALDAWLADVVEEVHQGRPDAYGRDVRPESATGGRWVTHALEIDQ